MIKHLFIIVVSVFLLQGCENRPTALKDVPSGKDLKPEVTILRYEQALFSIPPDQIREGLEKIYPQFRFFLGDNWQDTLNLLRIYNYVNDPNIRELYQVEMIKYPDMAFLKKSLNSLFDRLIKYYPEKSYPTVYTYVSGLDIELPVIYADTVMAISMDLFLGKNVTAYARAGVPDYMVNRFTEGNILPECAKAIADSIIITDVNRQTLLDFMLIEGKRLYFTDMMCPGVEDHLKIGYSADKLRWCQMNAASIWTFFIANQALFSSDPKIVGKMMTDAPFTSGFVNESPGRIGEWVGWQIVKAYMKANPGVTLQQLMQNIDSQLILQGSKYKPGK